MKTSVLAKTENLTGNMPLFVQYPGHPEPQPAYVELDPAGNMGGGVLYAGYLREVDTHPPGPVFERRILRWPILPTASASAIKSLFRDEAFLALCQDIVDGFEVKWRTGKDSCWAGTYSLEGEEAIVKISTLLNDLQDREVLDVNDFLCGIDKALAWENQSLDEAVETIEQSLKARGVSLDGDIREALLDLAWDEVREEPTNTTPTHVKTLLQEGIIGMQDVANWLTAHETSGKGSYELLGFQCVAGMFNDDENPTHGTEFLSLTLGSEHQYHLARKQDARDFEYITRPDDAPDLFYLEKNASKECLLTLDEIYDHAVVEISADPDHPDTPPDDWQNTIETLKNIFGPQGDYGITPLADKNIMCVFGKIYDCAVAHISSDPQCPDTPPKRWQDWLEHIDMCLSGVDQNDDDNPAEWETSGPGM
jgi:hypothetical protein